MTDLTSPVRDADPGFDNVATALTIAGSDSGGGAGIQADLKTFAACGVFGTSVLTLVTAQNTQGVQTISILDEPLVRQQFNSVVDDLAPQAAKTGALGNGQMIQVVADMVNQQPVDPLVVDPVMISKHGQPLMAEEAYSMMREMMLPHAELVTPNRFEAGALGDMRRVETVKQMKEAARRIHGHGADTVVVKGGHFDRIVRDIFYDGTGFVEFGADRVDTDRLHGSGCTFSAAITAGLTRGESMVDAIGAARDFITEAIRAAPDVGEGVGPVNPMYRLWS